MPTDACRYFYDCVGCGVTLKPLPGDCCVFCSNGDHVCPPRPGPTVIAIARGLGRRVFRVNRLSESGVTRDR